MLKIRNEEEIAKSLMHPQRLRVIRQITRRIAKAKIGSDENKIEHNAKAMRLTITAAVGKGAFRGRRGKALAAVTELKDHNLTREEARQIGEKLVKIGYAVGKIVIENPDKLAEDKRERNEISHLLRNNATAIAGIGYALIDGKQPSELRQPKQST